MKFLDHYSRAPSGLFVLDVFQDGKLIERICESNLIVDGSKTLHAHLLGGDTANRSVTKFAVGTSGTAPVGTNTALTGSFSKALDSTPDYPLSNQVRFTFSLASGEANGKAIMEFGLLTPVDVLYARKVRAVALNKEADITVSGTWTISF